MYNARDRGSGLIQDIVDWRLAVGPTRSVYAQSAFPIVTRFCMAVLYGRAGRLTLQTGGFRPGQAGWHEADRSPPPLTLERRQVRTMRCTVRTDRQGVWYHSNHSRMLDTH